ncbi:hypothetical protein Agub_g14653, partial [Astrephomene gubernaculifera]
MADNGESRNESEPQTMVEVNEEQHAEPVQDTEQGNRQEEKQQQGAEGGDGGEEPAAKKPRLSSAPKFAPKELQAQGPTPTKAQPRWGNQTNVMPPPRHGMGRWPVPMQQQQQQAGQQVPKGSQLTVAEIATDKLTKLARRNWSNEARAQDKPPEFKPKLVQSIYRTELGGGSSRGPSLRRVMMLEVSQYLENYLWPNFDPETASFEHVMSILLMINEKFREGIPAWTCFHTREDAFPGFFRRVVSLKDGREEAMRMHERTAYVLFMIRAFQSLEDEMVRGQVLRVVSLPLWHSLSPGRLQLELHAHEALAKHWKAAAKKEAKAAAKKAKAGDKGGGEGAGGGGYVPVPQRPEVRFLPQLLEEFLAVMDKVVVPPVAEGCSPSLDRGALLYCERFLEFLIDLLSQLPTRRFVRTLLDDRALLVKCRMSKLFKYSPPPPGAAAAAEAAAKAAKAAAAAAAKAARAAARAGEQQGEGGD